MRFNILYDPVFQRRRWLAYFDLLGTRSRIESGSHFQVFDVFAQAVESMENTAANTPTVFYACFSDSFLIYSSDDSGKDFSDCDQVARLFVHKLILRHIPFRGALSCGDFYADTTHHLYFGRALIEAYEYGEAQDWIGFLLTPSTVNQLDKIGLPADKRVHYAKWKIPFKEEKKLNKITELPAYLLGNVGGLNVPNACLQALVKMKNETTVQTHIVKITKAIEFIKNNRRTLV